MIRNQSLLIKICLISSLGSLAFQLMSLNSFSVESEGQSVAVELPSETVNVALPVKVKNADAFLDGGTLGVQFTDAKGKACAFYLDGRATAKAKSKKNFYWGGYPDKAGAQKLAIGSKAEAALLTILDNWDRVGRPRESAKLSPDKIIDSLMKTLRDRAASK